MSRIITIMGKLLPKGIKRQISRNEFEMKCEILKKYIINKNVLNCGCVGSKECSGIHTSRFLHKIIVDNSKSVLGADINASEIQELKKQYGFNMIYGDVETIDLDKKFDVVVGGDIIEHLSNPGLFLTNMKKHLKTGGIIIIHTPNAFCYSRCRQMLTKGHVEVDKTHVCYYDMMTLKQLLNRHGYKIIESVYMNTLKLPLFENFSKRIFSCDILIVGKKE